MYTKWQLAVFTQRAEVTGFNLLSIDICILCFCFWRDSPHWARASSFTRFLDHTQRRTTVGRIPLDEWSAHRRDLYLTTHNNHNRKTSMSPVGFEPTISAGKRPQTDTLDRAAIGTGKNSHNYCKTTRVMHLFNKTRSECVLIASNSRSSRFRKLQRCPPSITCEKTFVFAGLTNNR